MGMRHPEEPVALQAIEFWSTVSEEEIELGVEAQEVSLRRGFQLMLGLDIRRNTGDRFS